MPRRPSLAARLAILSIFYLVQGLPFGFQATALPVYLSKLGLSLASVSFAQAIAAPWLLKPLWAPLVDRYTSPRLGRRRTWIVPLQAALASTCLGAAFVPSGELGLLLTMLALTNLFAATMDIAVDGLAVDLLALDELGYGNISQVVGYKIGMAIGGGVLLWASRWIGWSGLFMAIAALVGLALIVTLLWTEPEPLLHGGEGSGGGTPTSFAELFRILGRALQSPGGLALVAVVATYKTGESISDGMFKPFLERGAHWSESRIGLIVGTWGMLISLAGSFLGGVIASRLGVYRALVSFAIARTLAIGPIVWLATLAPEAVGSSEVLIAKGLEEITGGGLTTAMFAFMMARVDRRIGATHYTLLAGVEVLGKTPGLLLSGLVADQIGFAGTFASGLAVSLVCLPLLYLVRPARGQPLRET